MNSTSLFVEHLIAGLQTFIWLTLLLLIIFGYSAFNLEELKSFNTIFYLPILAVLYPLGVFIDNLSDRFLKKCNVKIKNEILGENKSISDIMDSMSENTFKYFSYIRMRIRICRITFVNSIITTFFLSLYILLKNDTDFIFSKSLCVSVVLILGLLIAYTAYWNWKDITKTYYDKAAKKFPKADA